MIEEKDVERWYSSSHYRKKCDWICIDQPKVINEWRHSQQLGRLFYSKEYKDYIEPYQTLSTVEVEHSWVKKTTKKPSSPGCIAVIRRPHYPLSKLVASKQVVVLDGIQDPGNLGTIIRSMVAFGVKTLCLTENCADPFHPKTIAASVGTIPNIDIFYYDHWKTWISETSLPIFELHPNAASMVKTRTEKEFVLICGSEGNGVQSHMLQSIHRTPIAIRMTQNCNSLNAAMSVNIALFHFWTL